MEPIHPYPSPRAEGRQPPGGPSRQDPRTHGDHARSARGERSQRARAIVPIAWSIVAGLAMAGCGGGDGLPRERINGTVTLDGTPLADGNISFMPADPSATSTDLGAAIAGGAFDVPRDRGPVPGQYRVSISSTEETAAKAGKQAPQPGDGDAPVVRERIPAKYNTQSTLTAEVTRGGKNAFDFALSSK
jgi:hypothetical protein